MAFRSSGSPIADTSLPSDSPPSCKNDSAVVAADNGLVWTSDSEPGIRRVRRGRGFSLELPDGRSPDQRTRQRVRSLAIPPAWSDVWICAKANGHLQATGRDARGRKQYIYHSRWRLIRDEAKYDRMLAFGSALSKIRKSVARDLRRRGLPKERVIAAMIQLLDATAVRVGNERYTSANGSYGLTTLLNDHAEISSSTVRLSFRGKSGKTQRVSLNSRPVARVAARCGELPGQRLFMYLDENALPHEVHSEDINHYLQTATGGGFTAKDFRTWHGSVLAAFLLAEQPTPETTSAERRATNAVVDAVALHLGNTRAICRKCYIHPLVFEKFKSGELAAGWRANRSRWSAAPDGGQEKLFLWLLRREFRRTETKL